MVKKNFNNKKIISAILFILVVTIGMFLRFYNIDKIFIFGWDQARDAYHVASLLNGHFLIEGPKTGIGNFHLGPLYFYLLAPFFFLTKLDPMASHYLNMLLSLLSFGAIFYVTKKLFSLPYAFLALGMYAINKYSVDMNRIPWNVSLIPIIAFFIFYFAYKTFKEKKYKWSALLMTSCGMFFHAHFTAVVFPLMVIFLWIVNKDRLKLLRLLLLSLPFYLIWFIPAGIEYFASNHSQYFLTQDFFTYYFVGVHLQFFLYRLPDVLIQFSTLLSIPREMGYLMLIALGASYFFTKRKLEIQIIFAWLFCTLFIFGIYGGPISDYYFFFTLPAIFYTFLILVEMLFKFKKPVAITILTLFLMYYSYINLYQAFEPFKRTDGLYKQKIEVKKDMKNGRVFEFNEGDIKSYLYFMYTNQL